MQPVFAEQDLSARATVCRGLDVFRNGVGRGVKSEERDTSARPPRWMRRLPAAYRRERLEPQGQIG